MKTRIYQGNDHRCENCYWGIIKLRPWKEDPKETEGYFECEQNVENPECQRNCKTFRPQEYVCFDSTEEMMEELEKLSKENK